MTWALATVHGVEGSASDETHPSEENRRADERGDQQWQSR